MRLLEHFKELSLHPKNAEELKGLILQLAVQGKLTARWREENPDVEPASELLKRIHAKKQKLLKEKKIRKEKHLPSIKQDEIPFQLPGNWNWSRMLDLCYLITDGAHHTPKYVDTGVPFLSVKNLSNGLLDFSNTRFIDEDTHLELIKRCNPEYEDILLTKIGTTGIAKVIDTKNRFSIFVSVALLKIAKADLYPKYIEYCVNSPFTKKQSSDGTEGVGNKNLVLRKIKAFVVPLPPLEEQKAIVAVVNQLFEEVEQLEQHTQTRITLKEDFATSALRRLTQAENTAQEWAFVREHFSTFFTEKANIKKLRETILQLAVQGKLTAKWRKANPDVEHASELLKRIQAEKEKLIAEKKVKKEKALPPIGEDEVPYELPEGWVWCRFQEIATIASNLVKVDRYLSMPHIAPDVIEKNTGILLEFRTIGEDGVTSPKHLFKPGQIVYSKIRPNLNKLVKVDFEGLCSADMYPIDSHIHTDYLFRFMLSSAFLIQSVKGDTRVAMPKINQTELNKIVVSVPPKEEQKVIVEKVNDLLVLCDDLEQQIEISQTQIEQLMQSCLKEVFEKTDC